MLSCFQTGEIFNSQIPALNTVVQCPAAAALTHIFDRPLSLMAYAHLYRNYLLVKTSDFLTCESHVSGWFDVKMCL